MEVLDAVLVYCTTTADAKHITQLSLSQGIAQIKEGIDSNITDNNFPNLNTLVINALISCLEED